MLPLDLEPNSAGPPRMCSMCICELCLVNARRVVCRKGVRDEETEGSLNYKYLGVRSEQDVCVWAIGLQRLLGPQY